MAKIGDWGSARAVALTGMYCINLSSHLAAKAVIFFAMYRCSEHDPWRGYGLLAGS